MMSQNELAEHSLAPLRDLAIPIGALFFKMFTISLTSCKKVCPSKITTIKRDPQN